MNRSSGTCLKKKEAGVACTFFKIEGSFSCTAHEIIIYTFLSYWPVTEFSLLKIQKLYCSVTLVHRFVYRKAEESQKSRPFVWRPATKKTVGQWQGYDRCTVI